MRSIHGFVLDSAQSDPGIIYGICVYGMNQHTSQTAAAAACTCLQAAHPSGYMLMLLVLTRLHAPSCAQMQGMGRASSSLM